MAVPFQVCGPLTIRDIAGAGEGRAIPGVGLVADVAEDGIVGLLPAAHGGRVGGGEVREVAAALGGYVPAGDGARLPVLSADRHGVE